MPVPKRKRSRSRRDKRFANKAIKIKTLAACQNCQTVLIPHSACKACGYYKGIKVMTTKTDRAETRAMISNAKAARRTEQAQPNEGSV